MTRSLKKGPFIETKLMDKIEEMNRSGDRRVIRTWSRALDNSYLAPFFGSITPWVLWLIRPLLPGGVPDVLLGRIRW